MLPLLAPPEAVPPVVPIEWRATTLDKLLPLVGAKLGLKLEASPAMKGVPMFVRIEPGTEPKLILDAIARATLGSWSQGSDGVYRLVQDAGARNKAAIAEKETIRKGWEKALAMRRKRLAKLETPDWKALAKDVDRMIESYDEKNQNNIWEKTSALDRRAPGGRATARIVATLTPEMFEDPGPFGTVYSDVPTAAQRPLPPAVLTAIRSWMKEEAAWQDVSGKMGFAERAQKKSFWYGQEAVQGGEPPTSLGRVLLKIAPSEYGEDSCEIRIEVFSADGKRARSFRDSLNPAIGPWADFDWEDPETRKANEAKWKALAEESKKSPKWSPSPLAIAHAETFGWAQKPADPAMEKQILDPTVFDPNAGHQSERLAAFSLWRKKSLVHRFPDVQSWSPKDPFHAAEGAFSFPGTGPTDETQPVLRFEDPMPLKTERRTADRPLLARIVASLVGTDRPSLERRGEVAYAIAEKSRASLYRSYFEALSRRRPGDGEDRNVYEWVDDKMLAIWGGLTQSERGSAVKGIRLTSLSEGVRRLVMKRIVDSDRGGLQVVGEVKGGPPDLGERIESEPTVRWPRGFPDGTLTVEDTVEDVVKTRRHEAKIGEHSTRIYGGWPMNAQAFASSKKWATTEQDPEYARVDWTKVKMGKQRSIKITVKLEGGLGFQGDLRDSTWSGDYVPFSSLPKTFLDAVAAAEKGG